MQKTASTLIAALCLALAGSAAIAQSTQQTTKGGSDYERSMQQAGMSGMSGMSGMTGTTVAPTEKPAAKKPAKAKKTKKKAQKPVAQ